MMVSSVSSSAAKPGAKVEFGNKIWLGATHNDIK